MEKLPTQQDLAKIFGKSQNWVSKRQRDPRDAMPKDRAGAIEWGIRFKHLPDPAAPAAEASLFAPQASATGSLSEADLALKRAREQQIRVDIDAKTAGLIPRAEVEQREILFAAEFRRAACEYPLRARAVLHRHLHDSGVIEKIVQDLEPLAAELLNRADLRQALKGKTADEIRAVLLAHVEEVVQACC